MIFNYVQVLCHGSKLRKWQFFRQNYILQHLVCNLRCILQSYLNLIMQKGNLQGENKYGTHFVKVSLQVLFFEEDNIHYAYMPSFDLTGYGNTEEEAQQSLTVVLDEFLRYTLNKNTLFIEMQRLGWKIKSKKKPMYAPQMSDLINTNDQLKDIVNSKQYTTSNYQVNVPAFA
jgi:hypothetical protein